MKASLRNGNIIWWRSHSCLAKERICIFSLIFTLRHQTDKATGQKQRDQHKQCAQCVEPDFGESAGEVRLGIVHENRAYGCTIKGAATTDGNPDDDLNRID